MDMVDQIPETPGGLRPRRLLRRAVHSARRRDLREGRRRGRCHRSAHEDCEAGCPAGADDTCTACADVATGAALTCDTKQDVFTAMRALDEPEDERPHAINGSTSSGASVLGPYGVHWPFSHVATLYEIPVLGWPTPSSSSGTRTSTRTTSG